MPTSAAGSALTADQRSGRLGLGRLRGRFGVRLRARLRVRLRVRFRGAARRAGAGRLFLFRGLLARLRGALRTATVVGAVEARALEDDPDRAEHLVQLAATGLVLLQRLVAERLGNVEVAPPPCA